MALSKTDRFLSKAEILGVLGVFSPLSIQSAAMCQLFFWQYEFWRILPRISLGAFLYTEQMDAESLGRKLLLNPAEPPKSRS